MSILRVFILTFAFVSQSAFAGLWTCKGVCFMVRCYSDPDALMNRDISATSYTFASAKALANQRCDEEVERYQCQKGSLGDPVRCDEAADPAPEKYRVIFKNNCRKHGEIWTAIHYLNLNGNWETHGYWSVAYGETKAVANTKNRIFEFHGHTNNGVVWGTGAGTRNVRGDTQSFKLHEMPSNTTYGDYTFSFNCD